MDHHRSTALAAHPARGESSCEGVVVNNVETLR
jgi:hypothetical protein